MPFERELSSVKEELLERMRAGKTIFLVCECKIDYKGRAKSRLGKGERILILKRDGTVIVHQKMGRNPVNWMPPRSKTRLKMVDGALKMVSTKHRRRERMEITVHSVKILESFDLEDYERIDLHGTEKDFVRDLISDPSLIEKGFKLSKNERVTLAGRIDISGVDSEGNPVAVEVKRSKATPHDVEQLKRYVETLKKKTEGKVRGVLVAPSSSSKARRLLVRYNLELKRIDPLKLRRKTPQSDLSRFIDD